MKPLDGFAKPPSLCLSPQGATAFTDFRESVESLSYIVCVGPFFCDSV
jgi:hypothetical protein